MNTSARGTALRLEPQRTLLSPADGADTVLAVGAHALAEGVFRHDPPTPHELEQAIDQVEEALMTAGLRHAARGELWTQAPQLLALPGLQAPGARLSRDDVEALFQRLASAALGHPGLRDTLPAGREAAAALLILRECLHHGGFDGIRHL